YSGAIPKTVTYTYDVFGNRLEQVVTLVGPSATTVTHFAYDGENVWADLDGSNTLLTRRFYLDGVDQLFARLASGATAWYLTDRLGSIRVITNAAGVEIDRLTYDAFGNVLTETNSAVGDRYK